MKRILVLLVCTLAVLAPAALFAAPQKGAQPQYIPPGNQYEPTSTSLTSSLNPSTYGTSVILTAMVDGGANLPGQIVFYDGSTELGAGNISGGEVTYTTSALAVGSHTLTARYNGGQVGTIVYESSTSAILTETVNQITQTINFATPSSPVTYGVSPIALSASGGGSGNAVTFSIVSGPGSITGSALTITGVGTVVVAANQAGNTDYAAAAQVTQSVVVIAATPTLSVTTSGTPSVYGTSVTFTATVSSGPTGMITFYDGGGAIGTGAISGTTATFSTNALPAGSNAITAGWPGNTNYNAVSSSAITQTVSQAAQTINFPAPSSPVLYGVSPIALPATGGGSGNAVTFSIISGPGSISGNTLTITGVGTVVVAGDQAGNANYTAAPEVTQSVVVNDGSQTINFTAPSSPVLYGVSPIALSATGGGSGNAVIFSTVSGPGSISGNTLTITGVGTVVVAADQAGNANYTAAPEVTQSVVVNVGSQTINFTAPSSPVLYGVSPIALSATGGGSGNAVIFSTVSGPGSISGNTLTITGVGTVVVAANQAGNSTYAAAPQVTQSVVVNDGSQTINFTAPSSPVFYGVSPIALSATGGGSGNTVTFSIVSGPGSITGNTLTITGVGTVVVAADQAGNANYAAAPEVTQSVVVLPPPPAISGLTPSSGPAGSTFVTITGTNFGSTLGSVTIYGLNAAIAAWSANSITAGVPMGIPPNQLVPVIVTVGTESSSPEGFMVTSQSSGPPPCQ